MRRGIYGKLPAKRDFVASTVPRDFLAVWEPWLQGSVAASRLSLGSGWQSAFLQAPIWRFWLGSEVCGATTVGALMPSVDGVGRYFPLALFACAGSGEVLPPPDIDPQDSWMERVEDILLSALAPECDLDFLKAAFDAAGEPETSGSAPMPMSDGVRALPPAALTMVSNEEIAASFNRLRQADGDRACAGLSFWWTLGGGDFRPRALMTLRLPDPKLFALMLTGAFDVEEAP